MTTPVEDQIIILTSHVAALTKALEAMSSEVSTVRAQMAALKLVYDPPPQNLAATDRAPGYYPPKAVFPISLWEKSLEKAFHKTLQPGAPI